MSASLDSTLELAECQQQGLADGQLQIVAAPGGVPDWGNPLGTVVVPSSQIPDTCVVGSFGDVVRELPAVDLAAGTQYASVLQAVNGNGSISWRGSATPEDPSNPYAGGNLWNNGMMGPMENTNRDLQFKVCGAIQDCSIAALYTPAAHEHRTADEGTDVAQVITAGIGISSPFVMLDLVECADNGLVDAQLQIVPATSGVPDVGSPLGTAIVSGFQIFDSWVWGEFGAATFESPGVELTAGNQYGLVLHTLHGSNGIDWHISGSPDDPKDPYTGGNAWLNSSSGPEELSNLDHQFAVRGTPTVCSTTAWYTPNSLGYESADANDDLAQVITAESGVSHPVVTLELAECRKNGPVDGQLQIVAAPGGVPDWGNPRRCLLRVPFSQSDRRRTIHPGSAALGGSNSIAWRRSESPADPPDPYPGGNAWIYSSGAPEEFPDRDVQFAVCGAIDAGGIRQPRASVRSAILSANPNPLRCFGRPRRLRRVHGLRKLLSLPLRGRFARDEKGDRCELR